MDHDHDKTGSMVIIHIPVGALPYLAEKISQGDLEGRDVKLALEIEPGMTKTAVLKAKVGSGTWTIGITDVGLDLFPLFDV